MSHTHAVVKNLTLTFMSKQNPLENYTSIQKLYWKAASSRGTCSGSRFATIRSAAEWQKIKKTHKNRIYPKNQPRNMFARDGEKGRKYDVTGNENKKKQFISYSNFSLLLILLVKEINARSREQSFFLLFIFKCLAKKQTSKTHTHTHAERKQILSLVEEQIIIIKKIYNSAKNTRKDSEKIKCSRLIPLATRTRSGVTNAAAKSTSLINKIHVRMCRTSYTTIQTEKRGDAEARNIGPRWQSKPSE